MVVRSTVEISQDILNEILRYDEETGNLFWKERKNHFFSTEKSCKWWNKMFSGTVAFQTIDGAGYKMGSIFSSNHKAHRVIWMMKFGYWPKQVDHINGDRKDNRFSNLREVDNLENSKNQCLPKNNKSGVIGVNWSKQKQKWAAYIRVDNVLYHLGFFEEKSEAIKTRVNAETKYRFHENHGRAA